MADTKILQAILNGQVTIREDLKKLEKKVDDVDKKVEANGERIDNLGLQRAELEDDAPTVEEFSKLEKRVDKLEKHVASV